MTEQPGTSRIAHEEDKKRQTSHWDMDYLPLKEVEALHAAPRPGQDQPPAHERPRPPLTPRQAGLICIAAGLAILVLALAGARYLAG